jgi:glycosyltransferase involved in cell wall biosynthesis
VSARLACVPTILGTFHVSPSLDLQRVRSGLAHRPLEWISNHSLHAAIAVSEATRRDWISRTRIPAHRVMTIHNGIDPNHFRRGQSQRAARGKLGLPAEATILGGLGRLDPAKGFTWLIEALAILRSEHPQALVAIAGAGPLREELAAQAAAAGVADRVAFLGFQSDVNLVLDACDVFVLSSLSEALPFALLEAMAHELPAVGTTVGGVPEVIIPGETGFLAPPRDGAALATAIRPLLESTGLRAKLGRAGRERVVKHFHEADMVRRTIDLYHHMLVGKKATKGEHP